LRICNMCGCDSNETAVFNCTYAKGELNICLQCLSEGIIEVIKDLQKPKHKEINFQEFPLEEFDLSFPEQVFGFNCEQCKSVLFSTSFPVICDCGHINNEKVIQDIIRRKK